MFAVQFTRTMKEFTLWSTLVLTTVTACGDFYWRDYDGTIPSDAIPAGNGVDNQIYYIGSAYLHGYGIAMGTIRKGRKEIAIACYGVERANSRVRILCAQDHKKYYWSPVKTDTIKEFTKDKCAVLGGWDVKAVVANHWPAPGILYVGRTKFHDELIIGNIAAYSIARNGNAFFYFPYDGDEHRSSEFDILMYSPTPSSNYNGVDNIYNLDVLPVE